MSVLSGARFVHIMRSKLILAFSQKFMAMRVISCQEPPRFLDSLLLSL